MSERDVGYGRPPVQSRFKPGVSGNPKGRPRRQSLPVATIIDRVLNTVTEYRERGQTKKATRLELAVMTTINRAVKGDVKAAEMLLELRNHALRFGDVGAHKILMTDWLPDYAGQTAEQKTREFALQHDAEPERWWQVDKSQASEQ